MSASAASRRAKSKSTKSKSTKSKSTRSKSTRSKSTKSSTKTSSSPKPSSKQNKKKSKSKPESNAKSNSKSKKQNKDNKKDANIFGVELKKNKKNIQFEVKPKPKTNSLKTPKSPISPKKDYIVGDFVLLSKNREGIIGYKGKLHNNPDNITFYGIELLNGSIGDSDGKYLGKQYFNTLQDRAIFVQIDEIRRIMVGKDYNTPHRLDRRHSLQHRRHSGEANKKQTDFELAIYDVAKEIEAKCDKLDDIKEEEMNETTPSLQNKANSLQQKPTDLSPEKAMKKKGRGRGRKKGKAKSLALNEIRRKYEENAKNIDNERNKNIEKLKKRKSFNRVKLDGNVKSAAISGFKKRSKTKKMTERDKMKEMLKNEDEAIKNCTDIVRELGFLKYLKDYEMYMNLLKTQQNVSRKRGKGRRKKKSDKDGDDWMHKKSVSSIHTLRRDTEKKQKEMEIESKMEATVPTTNTVLKSAAISDGSTMKKSESMQSKTKSINNMNKSKIKNKSKMKGNLAAKFGHLNIDPTKMKFGAAPPKKIRKDDKKRGIDHSMVMDKVTVIKKGRRKRTRKKIQFDEDGNIIKMEQSEIKINDQVLVVESNNNDNNIKLNEEKEQQQVLTDDVKIEEVAMDNVEIEEKEESKMEVKDVNKTRKVLRFATEEKVMDEEEYQVFDMTNSNIMLLLSDSNIGVLQNVIRSALFNIVTLQVIEMSNCGIDDTFMSKICDALIDNDLSHIWCLNIQSNPIGDGGMLCLCQLIKRNNSCLTHIKLQNNRKDISTTVCEEICSALQMNQYIKVFEFEFRHYQYKDKCKKVLWRNNENARKLRTKRKN